MQSISDLLGPDGPFRHSIDGFAARHQQQEMAQTISDCIDESNILIAEAGTGTGKTFAYLVPAVECGKKIIISTGTKNLQDQLFYQDLPLVLNTLGRSVYAVLLKGRSNYVCPYRLQQTECMGNLTPIQSHYLSEIKQWITTTKNGDIAEVDKVPTETQLWSKITSTTDNCLGSDCSFFSECYVLKARKNALQADIVVINHHLFFADMALKEEGFGEIIPNAEVVIFDEAHQIIDIAPSYFGCSISSHRIENFIADLSLQLQVDAPDLTNIRDLLIALSDSIKRFRESLGFADIRANWLDASNQDTIRCNLAALHSSLEDLANELQIHVSRSIGLERCWLRLTAIVSSIMQFLDINETVTSEDGVQLDFDQTQYWEQKEDQEMFSWYETKSRHFTLNKTPMTISRTFREYINAKAGAWIFTSATLTIKNNFSYFARRMGIEDADTQQWPSPFDYTKQAILYIPENIPDPREPMYLEHIIAEMSRIITLCHGRTFILVTSHRMLNQIEIQLANKIDYPLLVQGSMPSDLLIRKFKRLGNAVLVGTSSFWQGVDVKGQSLSCVIIDKLPFAAPDEPKVQAIINFMHKQGKNPFMEYQLPQAVISLKQGVGRLIRDANDTGVLALCDQRVFTKSFGKIFLKSLPAMTVTRDFSEVEEFVNTSFIPHCEEVQSEVISEDTLYI